jgi:hypothetical protein
MRPCFIMGSAAAVALLMAGAVTLYSVTAPAPIPIHMIVGETEGIKLHPEGSESTPPDLWYFAILTAPERMRIDDTAKVEAALLVAADPDAIASLHQVATDSKSAIDPDTGLGPWTIALRTKAGGNRNSQADVGTPPNSPTMTFHIVAPNFKISTGTPRQQAITHDRPLHSQWNIQALDTGAHRLSMWYATDVETKGKKFQTALRTISSEIMVNAVPIPFFKNVADRLSFAETIINNASWRWIVLTFPALIFLYGLWKSFRERHAGLNGLPADMD